ncbi:20047_t:CDS:2, partial [Dentiscutata erythropus]
RKLKEAAQQGAKAAGFAFSVSSLKVSGGGKGSHTPFVTLQCMIGGKYRNNHNITEETRKQNKSTKRQNCPVTLRVVLNENTKVWVVISSKKQKELVYIMLKSGASTQSIADAIYWKQGTVYTKDIINERDQIKNALNEGTNRDTTVHLLQMLDECHYIVCHVLTKDGHLLTLFFTHNESAHQVAIYPEVLMVDATYKTNLYKLPLINAIALFLLTLKETIYDIFSCSSEVVVSNRALALRKAAAKIFPEAKKMVCIWHMLVQNLRTACRKFFDSDEDYNELLLSIQKVAYAEEMNEVEKAFNEVNKVAMKSRNPKYIKNYFEEWKKDAEC